MNYLLENAKEVAYLCFGVGFLVLIAFAIQPLIRINRILKKIDDVSDLFIGYLEKPLRFFLEIRDIIKGVKKFFSKK